MYFASLYLIRKQLNVKVSRCVSRFTWMCKSRQQLTTKPTISVSRNLFLRTFATNSCQLCKPQSSTKSFLPSSGPNLKDFIKNPDPLNVFPEPIENIPYLPENINYGANRTVYFDVYGCQMNVNDTEIIWSILHKAGFTKTDNLSQADVVLLVTCSIREGAEAKIWHRIKQLNGLRNKRNKNMPKMTIGILGCMAERLKHTLVEKEQSVDLVGGPDSYKDLPRMLAITQNDQKAVNVLLSLDETYADIIPVRLNQNSISAYVSIMRGCDNMCTYCIVPFTRGRERSRPVASIIGEIEQLSAQGVKEVTLLGQNVNSYRDLSEDDAQQSPGTTLSKSFRTVYKSKVGGLRFADLLARVADINPEMRVRFTSPHPKDFPDQVLDVIRSKPNVCKSLHIPAQSGNSDVLERMRRGYTREAYLDLVDHIRHSLPTCTTLSSDFIAGFCGETDEEFEDTITLMQKVRYNVAFMFAYSMREKTTAHRRFRDDVPDATKKRRVQAMAETFRANALLLNRTQVGGKQLILIEGVSKRSDSFMYGRNDGNIKVIVPKGEIAVEGDGDGRVKNVAVGDYVVVEIKDASSQVLQGVPLFHTSLMRFYSFIEDAVRMKC